VNSNRATPWHLRIQPFSRHMIPHYHSSNSSTKQEMQTRLQAQCTRDQILQPPQALHGTHYPKQSPEARTHTHITRATLTPVETGCPTSKGCCRRVGSRTSASPCRRTSSPHVAPCDPHPASLPPPLVQISQHRFRTSAQVRCGSDLREHILVTNTQLTPTAYPAGALT
jgi:hypothetical protein